MKKRILGLLLSAVMCLLLMPAAAFAEDFSFEDLPSNVVSIATVPGNHDIEDRTVVDSFASFCKENIKEDGELVLIDYYYPSGGDIIYHTWFVTIAGDSVSILDGGVGNEAAILSAINGSIYDWWIYGTYSVAHNVTVNKAGSGTASADKILAAKGETVTLSATPYTGYHFKEWQSQDVTVSGNTFTMPDKDVTVTAVFEQDAPATFAVSFDTNGGSAIGSITGAVGKIINLDKYVPVKNGFDFGGWYSDRALTVPVNEVRLTSNKTVYAKWNKRNPVVTKLPFTDVKSSSWSYKDISYVWEKGLVNGISGTEFAPKMDTSRAMIVTILWRMEGRPVAGYAMSFKDVPSGRWYTGAIRWAQANNIVGGYSAELFGPDDSITREQMAAILYRYAQYKGYDVSARAELSKFSDFKKVHAWAKESVSWANAAGLINGVGDALLDPLGLATREQIAAILHRFCENIAD